MKTAIIYGEFLPLSSTGIAYMNSNLEDCLINLGYKIEKILEPRTKDYFESEYLVSKKLNLKAFLKIFFKLIFMKKKDISFITLSLNNLGLFKTFIINHFLKIKSKKNYLYIHRGDLNIHYKHSLYKKILIDLIINQSDKVILLSKIFKDQNIIKNINKKILVIPNSLNSEDSFLSDKIYAKRLKSNYKKNQKLRVIYSGNIQKEKGVGNIIKSIKNINISQDNKLSLDLYGMKFQKFNFNSKYINYKGKLDLKKRLKVMSKYDLLIISSFSEGLPMVLIECLSIGLPFITTKVGAIPDMLIKNYPYICSQDKESVEEKLKKFIYDFKYKQDYINFIISQNKELFNKKFKHNIFDDHIREKINEQRI